MLTLLAAITVSVLITTKERTATKVGYSDTCYVLFHIRPIDTLPCPLISRRGVEGGRGGGGLPRLTNPYPFKYYFSQKR